MPDWNRRSFMHSLALLPAAGQAGAKKSVSDPKQKLVLIGAGSAMFTQGIVVDWLKRRPREEWEIALVDINPEILAATEKLVRRYMLATDHPAKITATTERREVLAGATAVICTIGVGSRRAWEQDVFVPRKHGIFQPVGDSVMPGGVSRSMRMIPPMVAIAKDAARLCPDTLFVNYSNPMTAVMHALRKHTPVPAIGLCIGTDSTLRSLARMADVPYETVTARWAGVNHLTWIHDIRSDGVDLWPKLRDLVGRRRAASAGQTMPDLRHPFCWELFDQFGAWPGPSDNHAVEFFAERFPNGRYYGKTLGVDIYSFEETIARGDKIYTETIELAKGHGPIDKATLAAQMAGGTGGGEHVQCLDILDSVRRDRRRWYSVNLPNRGTVPNLPLDAIIETPAIATADGLHPVPIGELPAAITAILLRRFAAAEATVEAAVTGNRKLMVEALILDGGVSDYTMARKLADELIHAQKQHLPQFA
jgi:alpha-galactosidase